MTSDFSSEYKRLFANGLVDDSYPLERICVQLPNGWYGINSILKGFTAKLSSDYGYTLEMIPSVSVNTIFSSVPEALRDNVDAKALKITHTGLTELPDPYYMASRPDLIVPQIEKITSRSYRNLPIRRVCDGFRYSSDDGSENFSLVNDAEMSAIDTIGIFFREEEYNEEIKKVIADFTSMLENDLKISTFSILRGHAIIILSPLSNGKVLEVARVRLYRQDLAAALGFAVLSPDNKNTPPFIYNFHVDSKAFVAVALAHSQGENVVLPKFAARCHVASFGFDASAIKSLRVDQLSGAFTEERFQKLHSQGVTAAIIPNGQEVDIVTSCGKQTVSQDQLEAKLVEILDKKDQEILEAEKLSYQERFAAAVKLQTGEADSLGLYYVDGAATEDHTVVIAQTLVPIN